MPLNQRQPIRPLAVASVQALGFFDRRCVGSVQSTAIFDHLAMRDLEFQLRFSCTTRHAGLEDPLWCRMGMDEFHKWFGYYYYYYYYYYCIRVTATSLPFAAATLSAIRAC